jgi:hypothetical protein
MSLMLTPLDVVIDCEGSDAPAQAGFARKGIRSKI